MVIRFKLVGGILFVLVLLACCVAVDCADDNVICYQDDSQVKVNNSSLVCADCSVIVPSSDDKVYSVYPVVGMYAKPSCGCRYSYKYWYYREFINYCPNCHHYNVLLRNPKGTYEREWTCKRCSSDFCGVCGKEKYSWSKVYLRRA